MLGGRYKIKLFPPHVALARRFRAELPTAPHNPCSRASPLAHRAEPPPTAPVQAAAQRARRKAAQRTRGAAAQRRAPPLYSVLNFEVLCTEVRKTPEKK